jgi:preprotein translocase subunit SecF
VDFTGGVLIQVQFQVPATAAQLRAALGGAQAPPITRFGEENEFVIRAALADEAIEDVRTRYEGQLSTAFGDDAFTIMRTESVGPKIGAELQRNAALAILFSFLLTLAYIAMRFELRFGLAAIIATIHDILITLGFLAVFRVEIALPTVAAILTIVGYSLNDTIVVFDRVRENLNAKGGRRQDPKELVNRSINETLPRTVLTSGTTLAVLSALLLVGGAVVRDFTGVLILGVTVGTYSSIFVASPALLEIQKRFGDGTAGRERRKKGGARATA